jgi:hypothetical protein
VTEKFLITNCRECVRNLDLRVQTISTSGSPWPHDGVSQTQRRRREYMQSGLMYKKWFYILLSNTKCQEISNKFFLETPLPKKLTKFFEGLLP